MTAATEETPVTSEDSPDPVTGLTITDEAVILQAQAAVFRVCSLAASRVLAAGLPGAEQRVRDAEQREESARAAMVAPQSLVDRLNGELAECRRRGEEIELAREDESLTVRLEARSLRLAVEQETEALEERARIATRITDPLAMEVIAAEREVKSARAALASLREAIASPFFTAQGRATAPYARYQVDTGAWLREVSGPDARAVLTEALKSSGLGAEIETNAIRAFAAGDPAAVAVGGSTKRWRDGTTLHYTPGAAPVVSHGEATYADFATVPAVPTMAPTGVEVMTGVRTAAGWPA